MPLRIEVEICPVDRTIIRFVSGEDIAKRAVEKDQRVVVYEHKGTRAFEMYSFQGSYKSRPITVH